MPECMFVVQAYAVSEGDIKEHWILGIGVTDSSEPLFGCREPKPGSNVRAARVLTC